MLGWAFDVQFLKSVITNHATMKFTTAISFFLVGVQFLVMNLPKKFRNKSESVVSTCVFGNFILMITLLLFSLAGHQSAFDNFFVEDDSTSHTVIPGRPSLCTMIDFILLSFSGLSWLFNAVKAEKICCYLVLISGILALFGHLFNIEFLYCYGQDVSTGMAVHTALFFALLGYNGIRLKYE